MLCFQHPCQLFVLDDSQLFALKKKNLQLKDTVSPQNLSLFRSKWPFFDDVLNFGKTHFSLEHVINNCPSNSKRMFLFVRDGVGPVTDVYRGFPLIDGSSSSHGSSVWAAVG